MTIQELILKTTDQMKKITIQNPKDEIEEMLSFLMNKPKWYLIAHPTEKASKSTQEKFMKMVENRIAGMPLQYIIGTQEFMGLEFNVTPDVLIPRPDTEILVEQVIKEANNIEKDELQILELCTGSGCIAVSLAKFIKNAKIIATDISNEALKVAKENASKLNMDLKIQFIQSDLFSKVPKKSFDIIVSNPPYIPTNVIESLQTEVKDYEPLLALDGGKDGLDFYRKIAQKASGKLFLEIGYNQAISVNNILEQNGFTNIKVVKDWGQNDRVIIGEKFEK